MFDNPFRRSDDSYVRDVNPVKHYLHQASEFLMKKKGITKQEAEAYVRDLTLGKKWHKVRFPEIEYLYRGENGDRGMRVDSLLGYIKEIMINKEIMAPTLTTYISDNNQKSLLAEYIQGNLAKRSQVKKLMFAAIAKKDDVGRAFNDGKQTNFKLANNAISGAHASSSNPLFNPTSHSTLTSNCRMTSAFCNANNERLLTGNRHYHHYSVVMNNIISTITNTDYNVLEPIMNKYSIHYPSVDETMECINYSSDLYWLDSKKNKVIRDLVETLSPIERAAFVYTGDLYHLKKLNPILIEKFIRQLATKVSAEVEDPLALIKTYPSELAMLTQYICAKEVKGKDTDYSDIKDKAVLDTIASTVKHVGDTLTEYSDFIKFFIVTDNVPASVPHFPSSIRRAALTSDTDSTIFTVQDWTTWLCDGRWWGEDALAISAVMVFFASQSITHILARMSINNGISRKLMYNIAMKNEYFFPVFIPTSVNKHYFASISVREGNVFEEIEREVKGVHLKNSNSPKFIIDEAQEMMENIMDSVMAGEQIILVNYLKRVANIERHIYAKIKAGDKDFFRRGVIKTKASYKNEAEQSPYWHYMLWQEVFAPNYGQCPPPPYSISHISTTLVNKTELAKFIANSKDQETAKRLEVFMLKSRKDKLLTLQLPMDLAIPFDILEIIDARSVVVNLCKIFYLILETLGYYRLNKNSTTLVSDII